MPRTLPEILAQYRETGTAFLLPAEEAALVLAEVERLREFRIENITAWFQLQTALRDSPEATSPDAMIDMVNALWKEVERLRGIEVDRDALQFVVDKLAAIHPNNSLPRGFWLVCLEARELTRLKEGK